MALSLLLALLLLAAPFTWDGATATAAAAGRSIDRHAYSGTAASSWRRRISQASSDGAVVAGSGGCSLTINGAQKQFAACTNVSGMVTPYTLAWTLQEPPAGGGAGATLSIGLSAQIGTLAPGWIALGFPAQPASMLGSTAFILKGCSSCPTGASIAEHSLPDRSTNHPPSAAISASSLQAAASPDGTQLQATFDVQLTGSAGTAGSGAGADPQAFPLLFAVGQLDDSGTPQQHDEYSAATVNLASGASAAQATGAAGVQALRNAHAWLMAISFGFIFPCGVLVARGFKGLGPVWFQIHRGVQVLGAAASLSAFIMIIVAVNNAGGFSSPNTPTHRSLGITAMALVLCQLSALVLRPHPGSRLRPAWALLHRWLGRAAVALGLTNAYWGITRVGLVVQGAWAAVLLSLVFGLLVAAALAKDLWDYLRLPPARRRGALPFLRSTYPPAAAGAPGAGAPPPAPEGSKHGEGGGSDSGAESLEKGGGGAGDSSASSNEGVVLTGARGGSFLARRTSRDTS